MANNDFTIDNDLIKAHTGIIQIVDSVTKIS